MLNCCGTTTQEPAQTTTQETAQTTTQETAQTARQNVLSFINGFKKNQHYGEDYAGLSTRQQALKESLLSWADKGVDVVGNTIYHHPSGLTDVFRWIGEADKAGKTPNIGLSQIEQHIQKVQNQINAPKTAIKTPGNPKATDYQPARVQRKMLQATNWKGIELTPGMQNMDLAMLVHTPNKQQRSMVERIAKAISNDEIPDFTNLGGYRVKSFKDLIFNQYGTDGAEDWITEDREGSRRRLCADSFPELGIQAPACPHAALAAPETSGLTVASVAVGSLVLGFIVYKANQFWRSLKTSDVDETLDCESQ